MAIAEMSTMTVVLAAADKEKLLDALQKTGAAQLKKTRELGSLFFRKKTTAPYPPNSTERRKRLLF